MQKQITQSDVEQATINFAIAKADNDAANKEFELAKKQYYAFMDQAFDSGMYGDAVSVEFSDQIDDADGVKDMIFRSTRTIPTQIIWDTKALKKKLPKEIVADVIRRDRQLVNLPGLIEYMRILGGDPKTFWSFFNTREYVDQDELDQLVDIGEIDSEGITGCYSVSVKPARYRVTSKEINYDEDGNIIKG